MKSNYFYLQLSIFVISIFVLADVHTGFSQIHDSVSVSENLYSVHSVALGSSNATDAYNVNSMFSNPASLNFLSNPGDVILSHGYDAQNQSLIEQFTTPVYRKANNYAIAVSFKYQHRDLNGLEAAAGLKAFHVPVILNFNEYGLNVAYAQAITPSFSTGVLVQGLLGTTSKEKFATASASLGLFYQPNPTFSYGIVYNGLGFNYKYREDFRTPNNYFDARIIQQNRPDDLELGITLHYYRSFTSSKPLFDLTLANEKRFGQRGLAYKTGIEANVYQDISLICGYNYYRGSSGARFGFVMHWNKIGVAYVFSPHQDKTYFYHQLSVSYRFF